MKFYPLIDLLNCKNKKFNSMKKLYIRKKYLQNKKYYLSKMYKSDEIKTRTANKNEDCFGIRCDFNCLPFVLNNKVADEICNNNKNPSVSINRQTYVINNNNKEGDSKNDFEIHHNRSQIKALSIWEQEALSHDNDNYIKDEICGLLVNKRVKNLNLLKICHYFFVVKNKFVPCTILHPKSPQSNNNVMAILYTRHTLFNEELDISKEAIYSFLMDSHSSVTVSINNSPVFASSEIYHGLSNVSKDKDLYVLLEINLISSQDNAAIKTIEH